MGKFDPLSAYLHMQKGSVVQLTFLQLQGLIGILPTAAYKEKSWWDNRAAQPQSKAWMAVGFHVKHVVLGGYIEFHRKPTPAAESTPPADAAS